MNDITKTTFPVTITVDTTESRGTLRPFWRFFGADEPNYATMPDGKKLLGDLGELRPETVYFRAHNLLSTGDGTPALKWGSTNAYTEDAAGNPVYDWTIVDGIFDAYRAAKVRPYVQIGFMPEALSVKPSPYQHSWSPTARYEEIYTGWAYPPTDYAKWAGLVYEWVRHCIERYGQAEVETWYWQVWNEPNIGYWQGTPEEFHKLHDFAMDAVRRALPTARVGGPDTAGHGGSFMTAFLDHCLKGTNYATGTVGTPLDFVSFHSKGAPKFVDGHVRMGILEQLRTIDAAFTLFAGYPELAGKPIVIGESDPDGCAACQGPQLGYRNGTLFSAYTAAVFARKHDLADRHNANLEGALTWAFEFEDAPWFAGYRILASNGVALPVLNVFRMFARMGTERLAATSSADPGLDALLQSGVRVEPDVSVLASRSGDTMSALLWHYHDDDLPGATADVTVTLSGLPFADGPVPFTHWRIDETHSNAFTAWKQMGSPATPTPEQKVVLEQAGALTRLTDAPPTVVVANGQATLSFPLPRQGVSLLVLGTENVA